MCSLASEFLHGQGETTLPTMKTEGKGGAKKSDKLLKFVLNDGSGEDRVILSGIKKYYDPSELVGRTVRSMNVPLYVHLLAKTH